MTIDVWFPLAIYREDLADAASYKMPMLSAIQDLAANGLEPRNFPNMAWTGDIHGVERIHQNPCFAWIVSQVEVHTLRYLDALGIDLDKLDLYIQRAWPIVSRPDQQVSEHCHNTAHISVVYYISVPNSGSDEAGSLIFFNDARLNEVCPGLGSENTDLIVDGNDLNLECTTYCPVEGRLLIFPAKQRHAVALNQSEGDRISLSFDIVVTAKSGQPAGAYEFLTPPPSQWQPFKGLARK
jgi:uncharacterized protein (TIGR02466 family)